MSNIKSLKIKKLNSWWYSKNEYVVAEEKLVIKSKEELGKESGHQRH
jgi:hypothetical protein